MTLTAEQRTLRRKYLGASDAAAILGRSPFATPGDVYWSKVGPETPDAPTEAMESGNRLEPVIVDWCAKRLGVTVRTDTGTIIDPISGILAATPDAMIVGKNQAIEAKKTSLSADWGEEGTDQVPMHYLIQAHHQMKVLGIERVWMPVLILAGFREEWRLYAVDRNEELADELASQEIDWWTKHVAALVPPEDCGAPPLETLIRVRREPSSRVILGANGIEVWDRFAAAKEEVKAAEAKCDEHKAAVLALLGLENPAEAASLPDGREITFLSQKSAPSIDRERFRAEYPFLYDTYVKQGSHRTLRIKKAK